MAYRTSSVTRPLYDSHCRIVNCRISVGFRDTPESPDSARVADTETRPLALSATLRVRPRRGIFTPPPGMIENRKKFSHLTLACVAHQDSGEDDATLARRSSDGGWN